MNTHHPPRNLRNSRRNFLKLFAAKSSERASRLWVFRSLWAILCCALHRRFRQYDRRWLRIPEAAVRAADASPGGEGPARPCPICFVTDSLYLFPTLVAAHSILHAPGRTGEINILYTDPEPEKLAALKRLPGFSIRVPASPPMEKVSEVSYVSNAALRKFDLPEIFPDYDRILYLDSDTLVVGDLSRLSEFDLTGVCAAAVIDPIASLRGYALLRLGTSVYINSGVMLLNLERMRAEGIAEKLRTAKQREKIPFYMDQDSFNIVLNEKLRLLPPQYNWMPGNLEHYRIPRRRVARLYGLDENDFPIAPLILHYTNIVKPWDDEAASPANALWQKEAAATREWLHSQGLDVLLPPR